MIEYSRIYARKFYNADMNAAPLWHGQDWCRENGIADRPTSATEILRLMGQPQIVNQPLYYLDPRDGKVVETNYRAIIRVDDDNLPIGENDRRVTSDANGFFGIVTDQYVAVTYDAAGQMWDEKVQLAPDTMAFLQGGKMLFISAKLPTFDVKGDEMTSYLLFTAPVDGVTALSGHLTNVRSICNNTHTQAMNSAKSSFRIRHVDGALPLLGRYLENTAQAALTTQAIMREAYEVLANKPSTVANVRWIAETIYKTPQRPDPDKPRKLSFEEVMRQYDYRLQWVQTAQQEVVRIFDGGGIGFNSRAVKGTAFGAFQAVAQFATWRRGTSDSMAGNIVYGDRAREVKRAYAMALEL